MGTRWENLSFDVRKLEVVFVRASERFSIEYRKTKTKVISLANHNRRKQHTGPIGTRSKCMQLAPSAGFSFASH